ncbi:MAG: 6-carboxytetrahydropterin synthase [Candidatus Dadabacteria bacterium]|nr:6-carboxytetrahydropterin synthase [Candidatus Dadabacteria bacterium]
MSREHCSLTKVYRFSAGHRLHNKKFTPEENWEIFGKCTNELGHGHDYSVEVKVSGVICPETGMVINLGELNDLMNGIIEELDHKRLDIEVPFFRENQPSGELIVKYIWTRLEPKINKLDGAKLTHLKLWETPKNYFEYFENSQPQGVRRHGR